MNSLDRMFWSVHFYQLEYVKGQACGAPWKIHFITTRYARVEAEVDIHQIAVL